MNLNYYGFFSKFQGENPEKAQIISIEIIEFVENKLLRFLSLVKQIASNRRNKKVFSGLKLLK